MNAAIERFHASRRTDIQVLKFDGFRSHLLVSKSIGSDKHASQQNRGGVDNKSPVNGLKF
jgi:hypothetical protein